MADAQAVGPATLQVIQTLLDDSILYRIPTAGRLVRLKNRFGAEFLEAACRRALAFDDPGYGTIKHILAQGLEADKPIGPVVLPPAMTFVRSAEEPVAPLAEVQPWN
jgi:hypothetical protein